MFPWAKWSLAGKNLLVCQEETLYGVRGVQQGSPLVPLFFSLALQEVLVEMRRLFDDASWKIWYLDDGTIFGNLHLLEQVLSRLEQTLPGIGLALNLRKYVLVSSTRPEVSAFPNLAEAYVDIRDEKQGFKVLGVPLGGANMSRRHWKKPLKKLPNSTAAHFAGGRRTTSPTIFASSSVAGGKSPPGKSGARMAQARFLE